MTELLSKFSRHYDPLFLGMGRAGLGNGMHASVGQSFPRAQGGHNLYRGQDDPDNIDWDAPVGAAGRAAATILNFADQTHQSGQIWWYGLRGLGPGGIEGLPALTRVRFGVE